MILTFALTGLFIYWMLGWLGIHLLKKIRPGNWTKGDDIGCLIFLFFFGAFCIIFSGIAYLVYWTEEHGGEKSTWRIF